ncbi:hypothetical protein JX266_009957 [Neoarthrinium moseri]|nr:hypothetical protein JX266_009957 [Neoarthrinium moseri]
MSNAAMPSVALSPSAATGDDPRQSADLAGGCMSPHYPLNDELEFDRYEHHAVGARDVMVHRIMENYMFPKKVKPKIMHRRIGQEFSFGPIKAQDSILGLDLQCVWRMLATEWDLTEQSKFPHDHKSKGPRTTLWRNRRGYQLSTDPYALPQLQDMVLGLVQRHFLELSDPTLRAVLKGLKQHHTPSPTQSTPGWTSTMLDHLRGYQKHALEHQRYVVFSGGTQAPVKGSKSVAENFFVSLPRDDLLYRVYSLKWISVWGRRPIRNYELHNLDYGKFIEAWRTGATPRVELCDHTFSRPAPIAAGQGVSEEKSQSYTH